MNKTILICLAAVVVLIIIIALAALRFLRADDSDPFEELPDEPRRSRRQPEPAADREPVPAMAGRRSAARSGPSDDPNWHDDRPQRGTRAAADSPGYRDRGTAERAASPDRRSRPAPVAGRPAKAARPGGAAGQETKWDTMSDVDYWAELAADKPLTDTPAAPVPSGRRGADVTPDPRSADPRSAGRGDQTVQLPVRPRQSRPAAPPSRPAAGPAQSRPGAAASRAVAGRAAADRADTGHPDRTDGSRTDAGRLNGTRAADLGQPAPAGRPAHAPGRYAGEPATQNIAALARLGSPPQPGPSGRTGPPPPVSQPSAVPPRSGARPLPPAPLDDDPLTSPSFPAINASDSRSYRSSRHETQPGGGHGAPAYIEPAPQFGTYPPAGPPISPPNGYPVQSAAPAGNPYGSFVSQPAPGYQQQAPAASHQDAGYPAYPAVGQEAPGHGWYSSPTPADGAPAGGYQQPGGQVPNGLDQAGYHNGYQAAPPETAAYQQPPYPPQYDPRYVSPEAAYGSDAYQAYPGYTGGY